MDIDISPADVVRSADAVGAAAEELVSGGTSSHPGNEGFLFSDAITRFAAQMDENTTRAAQATTTIAENLEASATLLRRSDDEATAATTSLWSRVQ